MIAHRRNLMLTDVTPKVSEAGRQRVLKSKQKNVHAGLVGQWDDNDVQTNVHGYDITYNPYRETTFMFKWDDNEVYTGSRKAQLNGRTVCVMGLTD